MQARLAAAIGLAAKLQPVADAREFFAAGAARTPAAGVILDRLADVGLGYLSVGQPLTTLSGGERQRLKLATFMGQKGEVYVLSKEEGGRHTPFFKGYRPQFYFRTTDVTGVAELPAGTEMVMPGDNVQLVVELITPVAMEKGLRFAIREGGHTVGAGTISEIIQ